MTEYCGEIISSTAVTEVQSEKWPCKKMMYIEMQIPDAQIVPLIQRCEVMYRSAPLTHIEYDNENFMTAKRGAL